MSEGNNKETLLQVSETSSENIGSSSSNSEQTSKVSMKKIVEFHCFSIKVFKTCKNKLLFLVTFLTYEGGSGVPRKYK